MTVIVDEDYNRFILCTEIFQWLGRDYYHKLTHRGYLRHLVIRKAAKTEEILVNLVTSSQINEDDAAENKNNHDVINQSVSLIL